MSDKCEPLIDIYKLTKDSPKEVVCQYDKRWTTLQKEGQEFYYFIRNRFNQFKDPHDFLFLTRTCTNGLIRFNKKGDFNSSFHHNRSGISPETFERIVVEWSKLFKNTQMMCQDYHEILDIVKKDDFVYLDPPYINSGTMYFGSFDFEDFFIFLDNLNKKEVRFALSFDGKRGENDFTFSIPKDLYKKHLYLKNENSPFNKTNSKAKNIVFESLYLNY